MGLESESRAEVGVPDLKPSVPTNSDEVGVDARVLLLGGEADTTDPFGVVGLFGVVLDLSKGVVEADLLFGTSSQDESVIGGESNAEDLDKSQE